MRTRYFFVAIAFFALLFFQSCDKTENPFEVAEETTENNTSDLRRVLIMDFTGHRCAGCPAAAVIAKDINETYDDQVTVLAVHPDIISLTDPLPGAPGEEFTTEWRTEEGNYYEDIYDIPAAIPLGVVSGVQSNSNYYLPSFSWLGTVEELIQEQRQVSIDLEIDFNETTRIADIGSTIAFNDQLTGDYNYVFVTVESHLVDWQKNGTSADQPADPSYPGGNIPNYEHNHILRNHLNGLTGEPLIVDGVTPGQNEHVHLSHQFEIDAEYVAENVAIYAYIYNTATFEILDVTEHYLMH